MAVQPNDVAILRVVGRYQDQNIVNNFHYVLLNIEPPDPFALTNLATFWATDIGPDWLARHSLQYTLVGVKAFIAKGDAAVPGFHNVDLPGEVSGDPQESYVCRTITRYTNDPNPRVRGRAMLSGGTEDMFDDKDGSVTETEILALAPLITLLDAPISGGGANWFPCVYNKVADRTALIDNSVARITPSVIRSRRVKQYLIG